MLNGKDDQQPKDGKKNSKKNPLVESRGYSTRNFKRRKQ
jgi:hypothetical protein